MKSYFLKAVSTSFIIFAAAVFVACGDDGDGDIFSPSGSSGSSKVPAPYFIDANGNRIQVLSVISGDRTQASFTYDEKGNLTGLKYDKYNNTFSGSNFVLSYSDNTGNVETKIKTNSKGLITSIESKAKSYSNYGNKENVTETYTNTFKYNSNKQLTNASIIGTTRSGDKENINIIMTWDNGNLSTTEVEKKRIDGETGEVENSIYNTYTYTYGEDINTFKQMPGFIWRHFNEGLGGMLYAIGLFGVGPNSLPTGYTANYGSSSYLLSYTLNTDGSIKTESEKSFGSSYSSSTISYTYK